MLRSLALVLVIAIGLYVAPARSNDISQSISKISQGLQDFGHAISGKFNNYIGCYKDHIPRVLNGYELKGSKTMTPKLCVSMCKNRCFKFAGVQYSKECFCGNSLGTTLQPEKECNMACSGDNNQMCGGSMRLSVYHVQ